VAFTFSGRSETGFWKSVRGINHISALDTKIYHELRDHNLVRIIPSDERDIYGLIIQQFLNPSTVRGLLFMKVHPRKANC